MFKYTTGANLELVQQLISRGENCSPNNIIGITKSKDGQIVWLEKNAKSGFNHILEHEKDFNKQGVSTEELPTYILEAIHQGNIIGYQRLGKKNPREVYEFIYEGKKHRVAVSIGSNGFIVGANPASLEKEYKL